MTIAAIHYFPVKGLSHQPLTRVALVAGETLPQDRRFAILHRASGFDAAEPAWKPKSNFLMLQRDEKLATLEARYDADSCTLVLLRAGKPVARGRIDTPTGRLLIDQFLSAYMHGSAAPGPYKLVEWQGHAFTDIPDKAVSLINLGSVKDLERVTTAPVDPVRFRGNLLLDGLEPWAEMQWVGRRLRIGGAELEVFKTITRCAAIEVNPASGERDMALIKALKSGFGHVVCGVYARVVTAGEVAVGDGLSLG
ncbi:MOSC domain-containing protein [Oleisolibacter albus]|uniref:MOSC domain-containing protein n=1 Tax=Oleisolibacter albus TaxID=2171757 RepID=UPI000DF3C976|nr:MOSC domain-containing protein [Oleisolibacter albus]